MAGGGFASHAMNVIKANRALLNKRKRLNKSDYISRSTNTLIKTRETTPGQLRAVRLLLAANKKRELIIWLISVCTALLLILGLYYWIS